MIHLMNFSLSFLEVQQKALKHGYSFGENWWESIFFFRVHYFGSSEDWAAIIGLPDQPHFCQALILKRLEINSVPSSFLTKFDLVVQKSLVPWLSFDLFFLLSLRLQFVRFAPFRKLICFDLVKWKLKGTSDDFLIVSPWCMAKGCQRNVVKRFSS